MTLPPRSVRDKEFLLHLRERLPIRNRLLLTSLPSGGDCLLIDAEGAGHMGVRITLETEDGARIYVSYYGVIMMNEQMNRVLTQDGATTYGDTYFMTQPRYETDDARYKWLDRVIAVAEGRVMSRAVAYRVFELVHE
jgi:Protein of unknown function (DUF3237)